jgi:hypothetical protein
MVKGFILNISKANDSYDITNQQLLDELVANYVKEKLLLPHPLHTARIL